MSIQVVSILELVRGIPCAATKRRHLRNALLQYMDEFDVCKCAPCPNNAKVLLSGTECRCQCQPGTYGATCEMRARDFTAAGTKTLYTIHYIYIYTLIENKLRN